MLRKVLMDVPSIIPSLNENLQQVALLTLAIIALVAHGKYRDFSIKISLLNDPCFSTV
jgi:hypothetical protein